MSIKISIVNQKGGVGKTTTAINLAACLAMFGKKTLLIDLDPQGNATSGFGVDKDAINQTVYHVLTHSFPVGDVILKEVYKNLDLVPAKNELTGAEIELVEQEGREFKLREALSNLNEVYDIILIDCPPSLNILSINALAASDSVLMPIQCEYYALEGISQLVQTINLVKENLNSHLEIGGILFTMADLRTNLTKQVINEVRQFFECKVYETIIPRNVRLSEAPSFGQPIVHYDAECMGSESYMNFSREFIKRHFNEEIPNNKTSRRLLSWLKRS